MGLRRDLERAALVVGGLGALGFGAVGATKLFFDGAGPPAASAAAPWTGATKRFQNAQFEFSFDYPAEWHSAPPAHGFGRGQVGPDGETYCQVQITEFRIDADAQGVPIDLARRLDKFRKRAFVTPHESGLKGTVTELREARLGGQEARAFVATMKASVASATSAATGAEFHVVGRRTYRDYGEVTAFCRMPAALLGDAKLRAAFDMVLNSFAFARNAR